MDSTHLIRTSELSGRAVVDLDAAEKVGTIDRVVLDPDGRQVAGFFVSRGKSVNGDAMQMTLPASAVRAIGPDAITMHKPTAMSDEQLARLRSLPSTTDLVGRKVVTEDGRMLGRVTDVVIDPRSGRIVGYPIGHGDVLAKVEKLFGAGKHGSTFLSADANLRAGDDLIVAPDGAVREQWPTDAAQQDTLAAATRDDTQVRIVSAGEWRDVPAASGTSSWVRRDTASPIAAPDAKA
jgi:sporulation protein YlmC with PRC-barrel domain